MFGRFRLDTAERVLAHDGAELALTQKAFDVLLALVERGVHVVTTEELIRRVWPEQLVDEGNLTQHVYTLRKLLSEAGGGKEVYIETVPRRGYRFRPRVEEVDERAAVGASRLEAARDSPAQPKTCYARSGEVNIAYQVVGQGPLDVVFVMGWVPHLEYFWKEEPFARFLRRLASFSRLTLFDKRGTGLSDRVPLGELPTLEQRMDDVRCVMEAVGSERAALVGGAAVEIGRAVSMRAAPGEVLVSHTVRDLVAGSGLVFEERGAESFDAAPGLWRLYQAGTK